MFSFILFFRADVRTHKQTEARKRELLGCKCGALRCTRGSGVAAAAAAADSGAAVRSRAGSCEKQVKLKGLAAISFKSLKPNASWKVGKISSDRTGVRCCFRFQT